MPSLSVYRSVKLFSRLAPNGNKVEKETERMDVSVDVDVVETDCMKAVELADEVAMEEMVLATEPREAFVNDTDESSL